MKVKELIEKLETLPQDARVWSWDDFGDLTYNIYVNDENGEISVRGSFR